MEAENRKFGTESTAIFREFESFCNRFIEAGKKKKVAPTACIRKL